MFGYLVLLFTLVPAVELALLIKVGTHIGAINTLMLIILTGLIGATLARLQGLLILERIQEQLDRGLMPTEEMLDGLMIFAGGIVLLTPGFVTDALGLILLIPLTRSMIKKGLKKIWTRALKEGQNITVYSSGKKRSSFADDDYEDADFH